MKKLFIVLLCLVAVVAIVSCKQDPKTEPEPAPAPRMTDEDVLEGRACYRLTATREAKRFALQYYELDGSFDPKEGDTFSLKYRSPYRDVDRFYLRDTSQKALLPEGASNHDILTSEDPYVTGPDEDGWYTLTFTFLTYADPMFGFRIELGSYNHGKFVSGNYIEIKDVKFNDELLTIEEDEETEAQQSNHGVWNATNTDHTLPELTIVSL